MQYERGQHLGTWDFSPAAVVDDFQRLAGKVVPFLPDFSDADRIRLRQELAIVERLTDAMVGRAEVARVIAGPARRSHPLFPQQPIYPDPPNAIERVGHWKLRARGAGSRKAAS